MARPRMYEDYFEGLPVAKKQLGILRALFEDKTEDQILAEGISLLYEKEKSNVEKMVQDMSVGDSVWA